MVFEFSPTVRLFLSLLVSLVTTFVFAVIGLKLASRYKLIDIPYSKPHKKHARPTPIAGGLTLYAAILLSGVLTGAFQNWDLRATVLASIPVFFFGLWDDISDLGVFTKLIGQLASAYILIRLGVSIKVFESPEMFLPLAGNVRILLDWFISIVWIVGITNAFNFVDSKDGLAVGLGGISAAFFMLMTLDSGQYLLTQHSAIILGVCIGLFFFNSPPALLFIGDSGSQTLGFFLAALAISYSPFGTSQLSSWFVPVLILGVPIFDMILVIVSRFRRNRPVYKAALDHMYHRLSLVGLGSRRAVLAMHLIALSLGCLAFIVLHTQPAIANSVFFILLIGGFFMLAYLDSKDIWRLLNGTGS